MYRIITVSLFLILSIMSSLWAQSTLYFGNTNSLNSDTLDIEIMLDNPSASIGGFQFDIENGEIDTAYGGNVQTYGWDHQVSYNSNFTATSSRIICFNLGSVSIPPGNAVLINIRMIVIDPNLDICLTNVVISDPIGTAIPTSPGPCTSINSTTEMQVNCSLLDVTDVIYNNTNLTIDMTIFNGDTLDIHYPYIAYTIDNNGDTIQNSQAGLLLSASQDSSLFNYTLNSTNPSYPFSIYYVYSSSFSATNPKTDTCVLSYTASNTSINRDLEQSIKFFPNPSNHIITLNSNNILNGQVIIFDLLGNELIRKKITSNQEIINLSSLHSKGTYFIKSQNALGNVVSISKLIYY